MKTSAWVAALLCCSLLGAEPTDCWEPASLWSFRALGDPQLSPDGRDVAYTVQWNDPTSDQTFSNIQISSRNGERRRDVTSGKRNDSTPQWSPDGRSLAYVSSEGGTPRLIIRDVNGGREKAVIDDGLPVSQPTWSPDGKWIAFFRHVPQPPKWAPKIPTRPAGAQWAADPIVVTELRWTFDGQGILPPGEDRIFVVPASGGKPRQVTDGPYHHTSYLYSPEITWSADSRSIITTAVAGPDGWANYTGGDIYEFPLDGGKPRQLTTAEGHEAMVRISPDGLRIAFVGFPWKGQGYTVAKLYVMDADGGNLRVLTPDRDRDAAVPAWAGDSESIYFLSEDAGTAHIFQATLDGKWKAVTSGHERITALSVAQGAVSVLTSESAKPPYIAAFALDAPQKRATVADPNKEKFGHCSWSQAEELTYDSFDGKQIQGWVIHPPGFDPQKKYPLLVSIHGGPHGMYGLNFNHEMQFQAGRGYVVLYTNPRGSTGYGEEFGNIIQHRWPGDDIKDILVAVDKLLEREYVDPQRLVVFGGSGGGLMTSWMVTQTDRFQAAVALYPVTNWFSHIGSNDNGVFVGSVYRKGWAWEEPEDYISHSPVFQAHKIKTPVMLITGEDDWRTPIAQSEEFYRALKVQDIDTVFIRVPGEAHGIRKRPSHRIATLYHSLAWFDRYTGKSDR